MDQINTNLFETIKIYHVYEYIDEPIVYSFLDSNGTLFLANWVDWNEDYNSWIYVPTTYFKLNELENQKISLRELIINSSFVYFVEEFFSDNSKIYLTSIDNINADFLPDEDSYIEYENPKSKKSLEIIKNQVTNSNRFVVDLALEPNNSHVKEIDTKVLGHTLINFQSLIESMQLPDDAGRRAKISETIREESRMLITDTYAASFGIRFESDKIADMLSTNPINDSLEKLILMFDTISSLDNPKKKLTKYNKKSISKFKNLLDIFSEENISGKIKAAFPKPGMNIEIQESVFTSKDATRLKDKIEKDEKNEKKLLVMKGIILAFDSQIKSFKFTSEEGIMYKGHLDSSIVGSSFKVPSLGEISINENITLNEYTDESFSTYKMFNWIEQEIGDGHSIPIEDKNNS